MEQYVILVRLQSSPGVSSSLTRNPSQIVNDAVQNASGKVTASYVLLGNHDFCIIAQFPDQTSAFRASTSLKTQHGWQTQTMAAQSLTDFDKIYADASREGVTQTRR